MSQVDDDFNELEDEMFDDRDHEQGLDAVPSAPDQEAQTVACLTEAKAGEEQNRVFDAEMPSNEEAADQAVDAAAREDVPAVTPAEHTAEDVVATLSPVEAGVEAEQPPQARERKLKPTFKKPTKKAVQKEETGAKKQVAEQPNAGDMTDSVLVTQAKDATEAHTNAAPIGHTTTVQSNNAQDDPKCKGTVKHSAPGTTIGTGNGSQKASKSTLPIKKAAPKAKQASGPPDPCSFRSTGKFINADKKPEKPNIDAPRKDAKTKTDETGKNAPPKRRPQAKSAYMFFCSEQRDVIKADENLSFADVGRRLGEIWRGLDEDDKKPYQEQSDKDKARVAALPDSQAAATKKARKAPPTNSKKGESAKDDADDPSPQKSKNKQAPPKKKATGRSGGSRASKRKANRALAADDAEDDDHEGFDYDWEADHEDVDWSNNPAECILAVTMKGKYVVKRKGASSNVCHVTKEMINDFEISKKGFEKDTVDHMSSRELDLGECISACFTNPASADDLEHVTRLEACAFLGDMRREGLLDRQGCKIWSFPDERMSVPIMGTSFLIQRLLECERVTHQEAVKENLGMKALLAEHGIKWPAGKFVDKAAMEE